MNGLIVQQLSHSFAERHLFHRLSFRIHQGEFVSLLGPSGCGKSTLLSLIAGLLQPEGGALYWEQKRVTHMRQHFGYMMQQDYLFPWLTVEENALFGLKTRRLLTNENMEHVRQLSADLQLTNVLHLYPDELSGGMRQRVALIRTLATNPALLLLDEPFAALDFATKRQCQALLKQLIAKWRKTVLFVTHDWHEALALSDRLLLLNDKGHLIHELKVPLALQQEHPLLLETSEHYRQIWLEIKGVFDRASTAH